MGGMLIDANKTERIKGNFNRKVKISESARKKALSSEKR